MGEWQCCKYPNQEWRGGSGIMKDFILVFLAVFSSITAHWGVVAMLVVRKIKSSAGLVVPNSLS